MKTLFFNINYFHQFFLVAKKLMTSAYNNITDDINIFLLSAFFNEIWRDEVGGGGGRLTPFRKTTFEKTSFVRVK